jgi:hypothetical protein
MATQAQIDANRLNAQRSTGPRTPDGKAAIRQNAFRHGFCSRIRLLQYEEHDKVEFQPLHTAFIEENQPVGINEEVLVYQMAEHFLFQRRASALLTQGIINIDYADADLPEMALMLRYHTTAVRGFSKALNDLRKLQKERKLQEIGFVSQETEVHPAETSVEPPAVPLAEPPESPPIVPPEAAPAPSETLESMLRKAALRQSASRRDVPPTTVHLTVDGQTYTQPAAIKPDPCGAPSGGDAGGQ